MRWVAAAASLVLMGQNSAAWSRPVPDQTLGAEGSTVVPTSANTVEIRSGARRGRNLFHSFRQFSVDAGDRVYFASPAGVQTILARVTGRSGSRIEGTLGVLGPADLFLLNPNGVIFGANARLDLAGSFVGTSASALEFGNRGSFSAIAPSPPSTFLTVSPSALLVQQVTPGAIALQARGDGLSVEANRSLLLVGGAVTGNQAALRAPGGLLTLVAVSGPSAVALQSTGPKIGVTQVDLATGGAISLRNSSLNVSAASGSNAGAIALYAGSIDLAQSQLLLSGSAGELALRAGDRIAMQGVLSFANVFGAGQGGTLFLEAGDRIDLQNSNFSYINNTVDATQPGSRVTIRSAGTISFAQTFLTTQSLLGGNAGNIQIQAGDRLSLSRSGIDSSSFGLGVGASGNAGSIQIRAGELLLSDRSTLSTAIQNGRDGNIQLEVDRRLLLRDNSLISASAGINRIGGGGDGGNVTIRASVIAAVSAENSDIVANAFDGKGGEIQITTGGLFGIAPRSARTGASDITASSDFGLAGSITLNGLIVDPSQGLTELPTQPVDASRLIARGCGTTGTATALSRSQFVVSGRGGLPSNPSEVRGSDGVAAAWADQGSGVRGQGSGVGDQAVRIPQHSNTSFGEAHEPPTLHHPNTPSPHPLISSSPPPLTEAQGWLRDDRGQVRLVAETPAIADNGQLVNLSCAAGRAATRQ